MKRFLFIAFFILNIFLAFSFDFENLDNLHDNGKYVETLGILQDKLDKASPDAQIIWRIGREIYYITKNIKDRKQKLSKFEEGLEFLKSYYNFNSSDIRGNAKIIHWYAILSSEKASTKGIKESLDNIPDLFKYCDDAIKVDQNYGDPYYLKAMIDDGLPTLFGGDKFRMSENLTKALVLDGENYWFLVDGAKAFINRGWDVKKKASLSAKKGKNDGSPQDKSDKEYAKILLTKALDLFAKDINQTMLEKEKIEEGKKLLEKL
ncbi:MAG: hypothetical protein A2Y34_05980 [Spirochaetes bacterium GWC1_27_15]|nr:MAG: hypothetical protein A2Z98_17165 [Spirochaetes bacterium GWB1_27_13]OHD22334.1 MAG: hypothetical protein A2Y34_05980 [Spirochaetes bacterium GWC1_27_15]